MLDLRNMPRDERGRLIEQGRGNDTSQYLNGHDTSHRPPAPTPTIQQRIYDVVTASGGAVGRGAIAKALGLKKTPWLVCIIEGLVQDGYLRRVHGQWKNGTLMYLYEVT